MITEEIAHINGIPKKLIVFLHGYQDYAEHIDRKVGALKQISDTALHIPQAPFANEIDEQKRQWFSMHRFDPEDKRRLTPSWTEFVEYYNRMTVGLAEANQYIAEYVDNLLNEYGLGYEDLILCGFSIDHELRQGCKNLVCLRQTAKRLNELSGLGLVFFLDIVNSAGTIGNNVIDNLFQ